MVANTPLRVCVVDDDDGVRDSLRVLLTAHGVTVRTYDAPQPFLSEIPEFESDCLIFDLHMPEMTGVELAERVRALHLSTPILIVTGRADPALVRRMERAGISAVLPKPVDDEELMSAIRDARSAGRVPAHCDC